MPPYMFTPERDLPPDAGFPGFGPEHLVMLAVLAVLSAMVIRLGCRTEDRTRRRLLRILAAGMVLLEAGTDAVLIGTGAFSVGYLPLHLCNIAALLCLWFAWRPDSDLAGQLVWCLCFPAGLAALLFPDWTNMPILHFLSLTSFLYHAVMVQISVIAVISGMAKPRLRSVWKAMAVLAALAAVVYGIDLKLRTNFMFLRWPVPGTPLMLCAKLPGRWGYLLGCGLLAACVMVLMTLPLTLWEHRKTRRERDS